MTGGCDKLKIAGIVLAGGLSSRMGQDKAKLQLSEQSLLTRAVDLLEGLDLDKTLVSGFYPDFNCITDIHQQCGPIGGLHACVEALYDDYDALFILPVDMPLMGKSQCAALLLEFKKHPQGVFYEQANFPMILALTLALKNHLTAALAATQKKDYSLYSLLNTLKIQPINVIQQQNYRFQNSNTPDQWLNCLKIHQKILRNKDESPFNKRV
ncbi:MAG: molybdopterin-guanine dinucleotide biosynthesis protein A [Psychromonas sp.]